MIEQAEGLGTNSVPHFRLRWRDPWGGYATEVEVDADRKEIEAIYFNNIVALERPAPKVDIDPPTMPINMQWGAQNEPLYTFNPAYAEKLVPIVFRAIEDWADKLKLDLPRPLNTNNVQRFYVSDQGGWPHCEITLTNGWWFKYRNSGLTYFGSPRRFFDSDHLPFRVKNYAGQWRLSEPEAIEVARREVLKLGYPKEFVHTETAPRIFRPTLVPGMPAMPRLQIEWNYPDLEHREQWIVAEVDCDRGTVESLSPCGTNRRPSTCRSPSSRL